MTRRHNSTWSVAAARIPTALMAALVMLFAGFLIASLVTATADPVALAAAEPGVFSDKGADSCLLCHRDTVTLAIFTGAHGNPDLKGAPFSAGQLQCEACHGPSGQHAQLSSPSPREPPPGFANEDALGELDRQCLGCHEDEVAPDWHIGGHRQAGVPCAACHQSHPQTQRPAGVALRSTTDQRCLDCHPSVARKLLMPFTHPLENGTMSCSDCHSPHGGTSVSAVSEMTAGETCFRCHADKRGPFLWEHDPVVEDCGFCHDPHGASQPGLLTQRSPWLCQSCHSQAGHPSLALTNSATPDSALLYGAGCLSCHSRIHGSNHPSGARLMR